MNETEKEKPIAWSLNSEVLFVQRLGQHTESSRRQLLSARTLLKRYEASLERRRHWWPGHNASDILALKQVVSERLERLAS